MSAGSRWGACLIILGALYAFQMPFCEYPGVEDNNLPLPPDFQEETKWVFARLMHPSAAGALFVR